MRKIISLAAVAAGLFTAVRWWRQHRRVGTDYVNQTINPWLERHGLIGASRGEIGLIEHVGRKSGTVRRTPIHPMPIANGFRIIVPVGERSEWARNVLAAGHCRLVIGDRLFELDEPTLEAPADMPDLPRPVRALFGWLGFRYLRLRTFEPIVPAPVMPPTIEAPVEREAVPA
ncbi:MAG: nitroreductase/quinone reductase family protein [Chloroflexota bacterium]